MQAAAAKRDCGTCDVCCWALAISQLKKPAGKPCLHLRALPLGGCGIYDTRPKVCRDFLCLWKLGVTAEANRPDKLGVFLVAEQVGGVPWIWAKEVRTGTVERLRDNLGVLANQIELPIVIGDPGSPRLDNILGPNRLALFAALCERIRRSLRVIE
jgi:Fe-S-cluster containining protein